MQQNAQASSADGQESVRKEVEEKETVGWSPLSRWQQQEDRRLGTAVHHHQVTLMYPQRRTANGCVAACCSLA